MCAARESMQAEIQKLSRRAAVTASMEALAAIIEQVHIAKASDNDSTEEIISSNTTGQPAVPAVIGQDLHFAHFHSLVDGISGLAQTALNVVNKPRMQELQAQEINAGQVCKNQYSLCTAQFRLSSWLLAKTAVLYRRAESRMAKLKPGACVSGR